MSIAQNFSSDQIPVVFEGGVGPARVKITVTAPAVGPGFTLVYTYVTKASPGFYALIGNASFTGTVIAGERYGIEFRQNGAIVFRQLTISDGLYPSNISFNFFYNTNYDVEVYIGCQNGVIDLLSLDALNVKTTA